jgi:hypothetical protein
MYTNYRCAISTLIYCLLFCKHLDGASMISVLREELKVKPIWEAQSWGTDYVPSSHRPPSKMRTFMLEKLDVTLLLETLHIYVHRFT